MTKLTASAAAGSASLKMSPRRDSAGASSLSAAASTHLLTFILLFRQPEPGTGVPGVPGLSCHVI